MLTGGTSVERVMRGTLCVDLRARVVVVCRCSARGRGGNT